tara:strand:- start:363 stop:554 length:192 start_codon:yes stop_codon:yes gene_type:complete
MLAHDTKSHSSNSCVCEHLQELDPLPDVPDAGRFLVERLQQTAAQAPQLAPTINQLAQTYQLS